MTSPTRELLPSKDSTFTQLAFDIDAYVASAPSHNYGPEVFAAGIPDDCAQAGLPQ